MHPPLNQGQPFTYTPFYDFSPIPILFGEQKDSWPAPVNDEELITSATWFDLANVGLITGSVIVDEDDGIRPAVEMSPRHTMGRMGSDLIKPRSSSHR